MYGIKKKLGFGCMRLPQDEKQDIDYDQVCKMVDIFLENGFNYFDTAHGYHGGLSEVAVNRCLTSRHAREEYMLTNKLSDNFFNSKEEIIPLFNKQLEICGVDYFDFYLMHAQNRNNYQKYKRCEAYKVAFELKRQGKIKHVGLSFHDSADVLDMILSENPEIEVVQIQYNYLDYDNPSVQSKLCFDVCKKHGKKMIVMEPIKGGNLVNLPPLAKELLDKNNIKPAALALRFAATPDDIIVILSGMSNYDQMIDNISTMKNFVPLSEDEIKLTEDVVKIFKTQDLIGCTACRYCIDGCVAKIPIPDYFSLLNAKKVFNDWNTNFYYSILSSKDNGKASSCIKCGKCEKICPQKLPIRDLLVEVAKTFERQ